MIKGSCLCGGVRYEYEGEITEIAMCHCSQCRRAQGTGFVTNCPIEREKFRVIAGTEFIKKYRASPLKVRTFCSNCGSPLFSARDDLPDIMRLRLGTVETPFQCQNRYHIYTADKAEWVALNDGFPLFPGNKTGG